jgi:hypothetical protein
MPSRAPVRKALVAVRSSRRRIVEDGRHLYKGSRTTGVPVLRCRQSGPNSRLRTLTDLSVSLNLHQRRKNRQRALNCAWVVTHGRGSFQGVGPYTTSLFENVATYTFPFATVTGVNLATLPSLSFGSRSLFQSSFRVDLSFGVDASMARNVPGTTFSLASHQYLVIVQSAVRGSHVHPVGCVAQTIPFLAPSAEIESMAPGMLRVGVITSLAPSGLNLPSTNLNLRSVSASPQT